MAAGAVRYALRLAYDGGAFRGWQRQPGLPTVQGCLEEALRAAGMRAHLDAAARTDAGVHALDQVVSFTARSALSPADLRVAVNAGTPPGLVCLEAATVPASFHARASAVSRTYVYLLGWPAPPNLEGRAWSLPDPRAFPSLEGAGAVVVGAEKIFDLEGNAIAFIDGMAAHDGVIAAGDIVTIEEIGIGPAGGGGIGLAADDRLHVGAPGNGVGFGDPMVGGFAHGFHGALDVLQHRAVADLTETGARRFRRHRLRTGKLFSPEGKCRFGVVFGAQEASKSLRKIYDGKLTEQS